MQLVGSARVRTIRWPGSPVRLLVEATLAVAAGVLVLALFTALPARVGTDTTLSIVAAAAFAAMFLVRRVEVALVLIALYLGCVDGPLKLTTGNENATLARDVLVFAAVAGVLVRATITRRALPRVPYLPYVLVVVAIVAVQAFNPGTPGLKAAGVGLRQHLEFLPLMVLATLVTPTRRTLIGFGAVLLAIALANTIAAGVQVRLTPDQFASWGPGYADRIIGENGFVGAGRTFTDLGGTERVRPFGLHGDSGGSGLYAWIAGPFALALLAGTIRTRGGRRLGAAALGICVLGLLVAQSRGVVVAAVVGLFSFFALRATSRNAASTAVTAGVTCVVIYLFVSAFAASDSSNSLERIRTLGPANAVETIRVDRGNSIALIPEYLLEHPLGVGIARSGPGSGIVGASSPLDAENQFNLLIGEVGSVGLIAFLALWLVVLRDAIWLARRSADDVRLLWCAIAAVLLAMSAVWFQASPIVAAPGAPFFWFAAGLVGCAAATARRGGDPASPTPVRLR